MFSHVCWQTRVGEVQHSFTSAGGRCRGPQEGRGAWTPAPTPTPGRGGTQGPKGARGRRDQSRKQPGCRREMEGRTDRHRQKARNEGNRNREGSLSWADTPREGQAGGQSKAGWGLGQAGTAGGASQPPAPPTDAGAAEGVPLEARLAVAAVGAGEVVARLAFATAVHTRLTLVHVCRGRPAGHAEAQALPPAGATTPRAPRRAEAGGGCGGPHPHTWSRPRWRGSHVHRSPGSVCTCRSPPC